MGEATEQKPHESTIEVVPLPPIDDALRFAPDKSPHTPSEKENFADEKGTDEEATHIEDESTPQAVADMDLIKNSEPMTDLEKALSAVLARKEQHIAKLLMEVLKLKSFVTKRKQTYKRKRKDEAAPTRALSAYNIFIKERFAELAQSNEAALRNEDSEATLKRVPPANLVAATGSEWKELSADEKHKYEERAQADRRRYDKQMAEYQPPDKNATRKRNKTGYNMFFSAHVLRLKQTESGVPSERGSVARLVADTWKRLSPEEKQFYEREADKHNDANPVEEDDAHADDDRRYAIDFFNLMNGPHHPDVQMVAAMPPHLQHQAYDPRHVYPHPTFYGQASYYDYSQHHQRHTQQTRGTPFRYPGYEG
ncbi:hypothetical protein MPSEU_000797100 [Mayamaea pseudoterrestris]|nr:hypothetical protein MPSEU_000797100 [Mayamaea pseudoterrestris]